MSDQLRPQNLPRLAGDHRPRPFSEGPSAGDPPGRDNGSSGDDPPGDTAPPNFFGPPVAIGPNLTERSNTPIQIAETFVSRQGEGMRVGNPSFFVRTTGCNLRCWFCDTPYASWQPRGEPMTVDAIVQQARQSGVRDVVLTGGEPLLWRQSDELVGALTAEDFHVTIETAGTIERNVAPNLLSLSPKLADSGPSKIEFPDWAIRHEKRRMPIDTMRRLIDQAKQIQVKFVISDPSQFEEIEQCVEELGVAAVSVWIMPQGTTNAQLNAAAKWVEPESSKRGFRFADRMQIRWYGNRPGT